MDRINNESKTEKYVFTIESGSCYILTIDRDQAKWLERDNLNQPMLRKDNQKIYVQAIVHLAIGKPAWPFLEPLGRAISRFVIRQLRSKYTKFGLTYCCSYL